ncbi:hypothetical protein F5B18DRAFT_600716 [Nemania serpens]|nr:hypothetical protein F5B18DRAFT_600716 [Nemania serpens]
MRPHRGQAPWTGSLLLLLWIRQGLSCLPHYTHTNGVAVRYCKCELVSQYGRSSRWLQRGSRTVTWYVPASSRLES